MKSIASIHIRNDNIGDVASGPFPYFGELKNLKVLPIEHWGDDLELAVIGGGGLIAPGLMDVLYQSLPLSRLNILWGVGTNVHETRAPVWPSWLDRFCLVGLRDYGNPYEYVPCASCMSPLFDPGDKPAPPHQMVVYSHHAFPIPILGVPRLSNWGTVTLADVIAFMASGEIVVTNSYHGVYWSQLLGKRVILWHPFSNRFHNFQHQPVICDEKNTFERASEVASDLPVSFLTECRERNIDFKNKVMSFL